VKSSDGRNLPDTTEKLTECYSNIDAKNHWQGDIYKKDSFNPASLPNPNIPYWMLVNRTCHLYQGGGRSIKLPYLNFIVVTPLIEYIKASDKSIKNAIDQLVKGKLEGFLFLPAHPKDGVNSHLVANFNLIYSFQLSHSPNPSDKVLQLSSPFSEHVFQRFSRFFYTVGYEDQNIKDDKFIEAITAELEKQLSQK
jgi:hypothetical protein